LKIYIDRRCICTYNIAIKTRYIEKIFILWIVRQVMRGVFTKLASLMAYALMTVCGSLLAGRRGKEA
jgi:hypothetical protein